MAKIKTIFLDIGGVLLTNGWGRDSREKAVQRFGLDREDFQERHAKIYNLHETDKISLDEYLKQAVFWKKREFTLEQFKEFMRAQSTPFPQVLDLMQQLKKQYSLRIAALSNEGREIAEYRIKTFHLASFVDCFFVSCFVGFQKPDLSIYKIALDVLQVAPDQVFYIDDRPNLIEAASHLGISGIVHTSFEDTRQKLLSLL